MKSADLRAGRGRRVTSRGILNAAAWTLLIGACAGAGAGQENPGTRGGTGPFLILHDWYGEGPVATPTFVKEHRDFLDSGLFDGLAIYVRTPDGSFNATTAALGNRRLGYEAIASALAPVKGLHFDHLKENFAAVVGGRPPDFTEDWSVPVGNFGDLARAARETGLRGIYLDNETYSAPWTDHPRGVLHPEKSLREYQDLARLRGRQVMAAMVAQFPDITVILLHGPYLSEPKAPARIFPQWQGSNELTGPFFAGFVEGAGDSAIVVDGGELYNLRTEEQFRSSREWRKEILPSAETDCAFLPKALRARWESKVSIAFGIIDKPFARQPMNPAILAATLTGALRQADRYVWLYVEGPSFLEPPGLGGAGEDWINAVRRGKSGAAKAAGK